MHKPKVQQLSIRLLTVDPNVQRGLDRRRVAKLAAELDVNALGVITVSHRDNDHLVVIDGQHRIEACREAGRGDLAITARVYVGLTLAEEATLFRLLNNTKQPRATDLFRVRVIEGDPVAVNVHRLAERHGWKITDTGAVGCLHAVSTLERVYRRNNRAADLTLATVTAAWGHDSMAVDGRVLDGLGLVFERYGDAVDADDLANRLAKYPGGPANLVGRARGAADLLHIATPKAMAEIVVELYNKRRTARALPAWRAE